jgi:hypothetical protein
MPDTKTIEIEIIEIEDDGRDREMEAYYDARDNGFDYEEEDDESEWTDEDEAGLEEWEEQRRERLAIANEY